MYEINIDEDVYRELERHVKGFEQPNDVLRRLLLVGQAGDDSPAGATEYIAPKRRPRPGRLLPLLEDGLIEAGDGLAHTQVRKGLTFHGVVDGDGWITCDNKAFVAPSPALASVVGSQIDGWAHWVHERSGKTLRQLSENAGRDRPSRQR
ncbi:hypothetical protein ABEG17_08290 [Pedococcus sp. KACC 23699]|uniref:RAMA domain-containing protein n=1 Tax=Pedococcus sp. KACC 23699 TaxID=3149228 RepID=A0AAU7JY93_9MICO